MIGRAPDLCAVPAARFYRKSDVSRRLREAGINTVPLCIDNTGWYHFLSITVAGEEVTELEHVYDHLVAFARTVMGVALAEDVHADEETFAAITALWPDAAIAEIAGRSRGEAN